MGQFLHRRPAAVHECQRFGQQDRDIFDQTTPVNRIEFLIIELNLKILCDLIGDHETGVMSGVQVSIPRVAESNHQFQSIFGHIFDKLSPTTARLSGSV
jgi:hypothetical protein